MFQKLFENRKGLSMDRLRRFVEVVDLGGVTRAANNDPSLQSQISRQVKELEEFFGMDLFNREGRRMVLNSAGERLATIIRQNLHDLEAFKLEAVGGLRKYTLGAGDALLHWVLSPRLPGIIKRNMSLEISSHPTQEIVRKVQNGGLDFGLVNTREVAKDFKHKKMGRMTYSLFIPRKLIPKKTGAGWKQLFASVPLAMFESGGQFTSSLQQAMNRTGIAPEIILRCKSFPQAAAAMRREACGAILPDIAREDLPEETFKAIEIPFLKEISRDISLVWNKRLEEVRDGSGHFAMQLTDLLKL